MIQLDKYHPEKFELPCVVDFINYEHHAAIDIFQHKDQLFKSGDVIVYNEITMVIQKKIKNTPINTEAKIFLNRSDFRKVRYFCVKQINNETKTSE